MLKKGNAGFLSTDLMIRQKRGLKTVTHPAAETRPAGNWFRDAVGKPNEIRRR